MITVTEFSSVVLRAAKDFLAKEGANAPARPGASAATEPAPESEASAATEPAPESEASAAVEPAPESESAAVEPAPESQASAATEPDASAVTEPAPESEVSAAVAPEADAAAGPDPALVAKMVAQLSVAEKNVPHLLVALSVAGNKLERLRGVRVVQLEGAPRDAIERDGFGYVLSLREVPGRGHRSKGPRRGGPRKPRGDGLGGKPGATGGKSKSDPNDLSGPFSMEAVARDRRAENQQNRRGGRGRGPGGGRPRGGGGGARPPRGPGRAPGGQA